MNNWFSFKTVISIFCFFFLLVFIYTQPAERIPYLAVIASLFGVVVAIYWHHNATKLRATLDLILAEETGFDYLEIRNQYIKLRDSEIPLVHYATKDSLISEDASSIRYTLNRYELVAIGIKRGIIDEKLYKEWCRSTLVYDWIACKNFVFQIRANESNKYPFYCALEGLAKKWAIEDEKKRV